MGKGEFNELIKLQVFPRVTKESFKDDFISEALARLDFGDGLIKHIKIH